MPALLLTIKKDGAERLWNYILAYNKMMRNQKPRSGEETTRGNTTFIMAPAVEKAKTCRTKTKT